MNACKSTASTRDLDTARTLASDKRFNDTARAFWDACIARLMSMPRDCDTPAYGLSQGCIQGR